MALAKFLIFTVIGCAIWCTALTSFGYALGSSYSRVLKAFSDIGYVAAAVAVVAIAFVFWHRLRVVRQERR
jgi:membrane protein DedA with SNARE-associated domain